MKRRDKLYLEYGINPNDKPRHPDVTWYLETTDDGRRQLVMEVATTAAIIPYPLRRQQREQIIADAMEESLERLLRAHGGVLIQATEKYTGRA